MIAHSFFMGCGTVFFETAASASFLSRYPSLPWVYVAAAGVNTVTGAVYARAQSSSLVRSSPGSASGSASWCYRWRRPCARWPSSPPDCRE